MSSRRVEKIDKAIRSTVSDVIQNHLSDPRIKGLISVTRVVTAADLRSARVYLSMIGIEEPQQQTALQAIKHARGHIQSYLASQLAIRTCPSLSFFLDDSLKKGFAITQLIDQVAAELHEREAKQNPEVPLDQPESDDEG
jgi:ribosome-binding factor A